MLVLHPTDLLILAENLLFFIFCNMFLHRHWKNSLCFVVAMPVVWAVQYAIFRMIEGNGTVAYIALDLLCILILYKEKGVGGACKKLFVCYVFHGVTGGIQALVSNTVEWLSGESIDPSRYQDPDIMLKVFLPYLLLSFLTIFALERFRAVDMAPLRTTNWLMLLCMPVVSVAFLLYLTPKEQGTSKEPVLYNVKDIMRILRIGKHSAYYLMNGKGFPSFRVGNKLVVEHEALDKWIARQPLSKK